MKLAMKKEKITHAILSDVINQSPVVAFLCTAKEGFPVEYVSENVRQFGYSAEELVAHQISFTNLIHADDLEKVLTDVNAIIQTNNSEYKQQLRILTRSGETRYLDANVRIRRDEQGNPTHYQGIVMDITERKKIELRLQKFSRIVQQNPSSIVITDMDGNIEYVNPKFSEITGYSFEEVVGENPRLLKSGYTSAEEYQRLWKTISSGQEWHGEFHNTRKDGSHFWEYASISPLKDNSGKITHFIAVKEDITEHKQLEKALQASEQKYRNLFEQSKDVICFTTSEGKFLDINKAGLSLFGYNSTEEITRIDIAEELYWNPEEREKFKAAIEKYGHVQDFEVDLKRKNGQRITVLITATPAREENADLIGYRAIIRDITEQKKLQQQLIQAQKMEAIGTLAGGIAHDFNNILAALLGYTELLRDDLEENNRDIAKENLNGIYNAGMRAKELVKQILSFSHKTGQEFKEIQIYLIVNEALKLLRASIPPSIEIRKSLKDKNALVKADATQIHQLVMNLCTNAYQAMEHDGGILEVSLQKLIVLHHQIFDGVKLSPGQYIQFSVSDTGCGMEEQTLKQIFDPFFTTKPVGKGTGMGLSVVHGIVKSHGGEITVSSQLGEGSIFKIFLPLQEKSMRSAPPTDEMPVGGNERILFIDDELPIVKISKELLQNLGYQVTVKTKANQAIELFKLRPDEFDLVITDFYMPKLNGMLLVEELRKLRADIPIIMISGFVDHQTIERVKKIGVQEFLRKPLMTMEIAKVIRKVLDNAKQ